MDAKVPRQDGSQQGLSDADGHRPAVSADDGQRPSLTDNDRQRPPVSDGDRYRHQQKSELHTNTIREAVARFDKAGVPRSERTLVRWCGRDASGMGRLDCVFDQNERRYLVTPESIERAIEEEKARRTKSGEEKPVATNTSDPVDRSAPQDTAHLEKKLSEANATIRWKDQLITQLGEDRGRLFGEIRRVVDKLSEANREIGRLETEVRPLEAPRKRPKREPTARHDLP